MDLTKGRNTTVNGYIWETLGINTCGKCALYHKFMFLKLENNIEHSWSLLHYKYNDSFPTTNKFTPQNRFYDDFLLSLVLYFSLDVQVSEYSELQRIRKWYLGFAFKHWSKGNTADTRNKNKLQITVKVGGAGIWEALILLYLLEIKGISIKFLKKSKWQDQWLRINI